VAEIITSLGSVDLKYLCGWGVKDKDFNHIQSATEDLVREQFDLWGSKMPQFQIRGGRPYQAGGRMMLWEVGRKLINADPLNYPQEVGDCVSFGAKNAIEYVQFVPMAKGERLKWTMAFPPYLWGCGRIFIGKNQLGRQDGSVGVWQAEAVKQYGMIAKDAEGVPQYSGSVARQWGNMPGPADKWVTLGKEHLIKTTAPIQSWEDFVQAITNGYPVTVASNVGYTMSVQRDGFHHRQGSWPHQMCFIGVDDDPQDPYACLLNSWGDVFGQVKDFKTGEIWPKGTLRVRKDDVMAQLREQDSFAYSAFVGFPAQELTRDDFNLW
jgi:hypothetical protein